VAGVSGVILLSVAVLLLCGCPGAAAEPSRPQDVLRVYAQALQAGKIDQAYGLLSDEAKRQLSFKAFTQLVKSSPEDVAEIVRVLKRPSSKPIVTARIMAPNGDELTLIYEDGAWRVDGRTLDRYGQYTPRQALLGFLRAYDRKRYDIVMRYVPEREKRGEPEAIWGTGSDQRFAGTTADSLKAAWEGEQKAYISRIVQAVRTALPNARIEETSDRAVMPYGGGGTVLFLREEGLWKIEDLK
jgi:hypothetical protein